MTSETFAHSLPAPPDDGSPAWEPLLRASQAWYAAHRSLDVPPDSEDAQGRALAARLEQLRDIRAGTRDGVLTDAQVARLDRLGMRWHSGRDVLWERFYAAAAAYHRAHRTLPEDPQFVTEDGVLLGAWLTRLRTARRLGLYCSYLTAPHIAALDALGMAWERFDVLFERNYHSAALYYEVHGGLECPPDYVDDAGVKLGAWLQFLRAQRRDGGLDPLQVRMLDALGMRWGSKQDNSWDTAFSALRAYVSRTGQTDVPAALKEGTIPLGRWYRRQRELHAAGRLRQDRAARLQSLGLDLAPEDHWGLRFRLAKAYSEAHGGSLNVPHDYVVEGVWLSKWLSEQRLMGEGKRKKQLTPAQRQMLESIGMVFGRTHADRAWEAHFHAVKAYVEETGSTRIPADLHDGSANLKSWLARQLRRYREGRLTAEQVRCLAALGMIPG